MHPCYKHNNKNIILIHEFKEYCAILFIKGSLLKDPEKILVSQTKDVSNARQIRFTNKKDINKQIIIQYIKEAILIEDSGIKTPKKELILIQELKDTFNEIKGLEEAFNNLTPGRQRGYNIYFSNAKQSKTRLSRIKNNIDKIMSGQGLKD